MASETPLQPESESSSDIIKAISDIAANVKLGSAAFSSSIDALSKSIETLKSSLSDSIRSIKSTANNTTQSPSTQSQRASQGRSASAQDPAVVRAKEEEKKIKAETRALNIKTAQERAIFNAKKLQQQIESSNEAKNTRKKKADADTQLQMSADVFANVGKGFGSVFDVSKAQMADMRKSGKKGGKEKPFNMDMGALSSSAISEFEMLFEDLASAFSNGSKGSENNSDVVDVAYEIEKTRNEEALSLVAEINAMLGSATDQAQALRLEMEAALDPRTLVEQAQDAIDSLSTDSVESSSTQNMPGFNENIFDLSASTEAAESSIRSLINAVLNLTGAAGLGADAADRILSQSEDSALEIASAFDRILQQQAGQTSGGEFSLHAEDLAMQASDLAVNFGLIMQRIQSGEASIAGFSDVINFATSNVSNLIEEMKLIKNPSDLNSFVGPQQPVGPPVKTKKDDLEERQRKAIAGIDKFGLAFDVLFGSMGKTMQKGLSGAVSYLQNDVGNGFSAAIEGVSKSNSIVGGAISGIGNVSGKIGSIFKSKKPESTITKMSSSESEGFPGGINGDEFPESKPQRFSSGGTVGYYAKGTKPKSGLGGIFESIGDTFNSFFGGGKKKKKKKKTPLNNDGVEWNNWDTKTYFERKYHSDGGEIEDDNENNGGKEQEFIPKPPVKGTDDQLAMLTIGEKVVKESAANKPENAAVIDAMNASPSGKVQHFSKGGTVGYFAAGSPPWSSFVPTANNTRTAAQDKGLTGGLASMALGPVGKAFSVLTGSVKAASDAIGMFGSFVAKNNPAIMEQVNLAMNDLQGVIGRALVPAVQTLLPVLRYMGDGMDFMMKMLMPTINPLVSAFKTLMMPVIELQSVITQFLAPAFEIVAVAVEGFAIMLDPVIQLVSEVVESFTQLLDSFLGGIPISKLMIDGFQILGQIVKILVGALVGVLGLFMTGMGAILQLAGILVQGFGYLIKGVGTLLSYIPMMGTLGAVLTEAGSSVAAGGQSIVKSGQDLYKKGEEQRDRGLAKMKEGGENIIGKFTDPNYKMKDNTRYKPGDVTGVGMKKGSSVGAAVREAQSTSISGVGDEIRKQALMAATGAKTQEESLAEIAKGLSKQNLADAVKAGVIAANADNKGGPPIVGGNNPMRRPKPLMAPV